MPQMTKGARIDTDLMEILLMTIAELHHGEQGPTWSRASTASKHPQTRAKSSFATETFRWSALMSEDSPFLSPWTYGRHLLLPSSSSYCCSYATIIPSSPPGGPETGASCKSRPLGLLHLVDICWHPGTNSWPTVLVHPSLTTASWMSQQLDHQPCSSEDILERSAPAHDSCSIQSFHDAQSSFSADVLHSSVFGHGWAGKISTTSLFSHPWSSGWTGEVAPPSRRVYCQRDSTPSGTVDFRTWWVGTHLLNSDLPSLSTLAALVPLHQVDGLLDRTGLLSQDIINQVAVR